jgi:hypothetical protein
MIDWLGWLKRLEFATVGALGIAALCLMIGETAERYADATTAAAARVAAREAQAAHGSGVQFEGVDYSMTGAIKRPIGAAAPCKVGD